ncbi:cellobiose dehydrogenase-like protein [Clathrospora elynae]|uniref:Cellobiose dehydrogenase-like protein n=1 Tax=Clathrospora elynae TaxID=706981 RepID=A0A6A5S9S0_9PLEO|nr:cellobiose dehydrogenase-like protein [Clathrospora elynae]
MRTSALTLWLAIVAVTALGQTTKRYCDTATSICYSGWTGTNGITFGVALPASKSAPFDTILQIVSPIKNGWVGFSWGGIMPYVPLTNGFVAFAKLSGDRILTTTSGLSLPQPYADAEYSYVKGTGYNTTHWTLIVRCRGCSQWHNVDGNLVSIDAGATTQKLAYGLSSKLPAQPANNMSTFNVHSSFSNYKIEITQGQNADFDNLVTVNLVNESPPIPSSAPTASSTVSLRPTTLSTSAVPSATPGPVQTGVPSSCAHVAKLAFPVNTAKGWKVTKVAGGLTQPLGLIFDTAGNILVIENGLGITVHEVLSNGCLTSSKILITQRNLNYGIALSRDGKTLYASSATFVFAWSYDVATMSLSGNASAIVTGMDSNWHVTRTLIIPPKHPKLMFVSHGSNDNFEYGAGDIKTGRSCVKLFDTTTVPASGYDYATFGTQMSYGLRNTVGLAFDSNGMLWGVENSSDELHRNVNGTSVDIHIDNPADELNHLGDPSKENKEWYGYPTYYTCSNPDGMPDRKFEVGEQFFLESNATFMDDTCKTRSIPPRLALPTHSAPLDARFDKNGTSLYITIHGSWNRNPSVGFKIIEVPFSKEVNGLDRMPA